MEDERTEKDRNDRRPVVEIPTPWGPFKLRGHDLVSITMFVFVCSVLYIFYNIWQEGAEMHKAILTQGFEHTFIIHLSPEERAALKLPMPDSLRKKVGQEEYYEFLQERYKKELERDVLSGRVPNGGIKQFTPKELQAGQSKGNP